MIRIAQPFGSDMKTLIDTMKKNILKKISWLNCLISFNVNEMFDTIKELNLFGFIIKTLNPCFPS